MRRLLTATAAWGALVATALAPSAAASASGGSQLDANGFPNNTYPLYPPLAATTYVDQNLAQVCPGVGGLLCGDNAINTIQPRPRLRVAEALIQGGGWRA